MQKTTKLVNLKIHTIKVVFIQVNISLKNHGHQTTYTH